MPEVFIDVNIQKVFEKQTGMRLAQPSSNGGTSENGPLTWRFFSPGILLYLLGLLKHNAHGGYENNVILRLYV